MSVRIAWLFGLAGLVPFGVAVLAIWSPGTVMLGMAPGVALGIYCTVVLAFLGGARFGADMRLAEGPGPGTLVFSLGPGLIALIACAFGSAIGLRWLFVGLILAFALQAGWDFKVQNMPTWAGRLRAVIGLGGVAALLGALVAT